MECQCEAGAPDGSEMEFPPPAPHPRIFQQQSAQGAKIEVANTTENC